MRSRPATITVDVTPIPNEKYEALDVKRGLRNADGSGVIAGLSRVSSVKGTAVEQGETVSTEGELCYRGILINDLVQTLGAESRYQFEDTAFLLLVGRLPNMEEAEWFREEIARDRGLSTDITAYAIEHLKSPNVMNKLETVVSALYIKDNDPDSLDPETNFEKAISLIAKFPTIIAYAYLSYYKPGAKLVQAPLTMSQSEAFLYMLREGQSADPLESSILDLCLVLHAEHGGGNNSSFTTHVTTSSGTDIYSSTIASIASLKGPLHGSANKKVMDMMAEIKSNVADWNSESELSAYLSKILDGNAHDGSGKIYGLGHAVYTASDPRAIVLKTKAQELAKAKGRESEYQLYLNIEKLGPELFYQRKGKKKIVAANVDFFSGFVYDCLGIPEAVYTPMFALARIAGWSAHRIEEIISGRRIIRPAYKFVG